jgi:hypothetical protein
MAKPATRVIQGAPADSRVTTAVVNLMDQFSICGLDHPLSITVKKGELEKLKAVIRNSPHLLLMDNHNERQGTTTIWGVEIKEE